MIKKLIILAVVLSATSTLNAQEYIESGNQSFGIGINPIFSYLGNMFNNSVNSHLNLNSASFTYRKFTAENRAKRLHFFGQGHLHNTATNNATITNMWYAVEFAWGKEYRKNIKRYSLYTGYEFQVGTGNLAEKIKYTKDLQDFEMMRNLSSNSGYHFYGGMGAIFGAEYILTRNVFIGLESIMPVRVGYITDRILEREVRDPNDSAIITKEKERIKNGVQASFSTAQLIQIRGGFFF